MITADKKKLSTKIANFRQTRLETLHIIVGIQAGKPVCLCLHE